MRRSERRAIPAPQRPPAVRPRRQPRQPRAENRRLYFIEPRVHAVLVVMVAGALTAIAQPLDPVGELNVVGDDGASVPERPQVLRRVEAECAGRAHRPDLPTVARRQVSLRAVLDDHEIVAGGNGAQRGHVCGLAVEVHGHDGCRAARDGRLHSARIDGEPIGVDVGEDRSRLGHHDGEGGVGRRERRRDDLVAWPDAQPAQRQGQRVGARPDADRRRRPGCGSELLLEPLQLGTQDEPAAIDDPADRRVDERPILAGLQGQKRNLHQLPATNDERPATSDQRPVTSTS